MARLAATEGVRLNLSNSTSTAYGAGMWQVSKTFAASSTFTNLIKFDQSSSPSAWVPWSLRILYSGFRASTNYTEIVVGRYELAGRINTNGDMTITDAANTPSGNQVIGFEVMEDGTGILYRARCTDSTGFIGAKVIFLTQAWNRISVTLY